MKSRFEAYAPMDRRLALARGESLPERVNGAVLFADISGFSALTELLTQSLGPLRGAEELSWQLERVYGALIDEVHRFQGSVITFAGDAITCWFDGDEGLAATTCALEMQQVINRLPPFQVGETEVAFTVKIVVMAGQAKRFLVGDEQNQLIDVLAGSLLDRMAAGEQVLRSEEIGVGPNVWRHLGERVEWLEERSSSLGDRMVVVRGLTARAEPNPWPPMPADVEGVGRGWLLPAVTRRLELQKEQLLAELRLASPCFVRFGGIDYDGDDQASAKLRRFIGWVLEVLNRYEGNLVQLTMGDKGNCLYILFGAPISHEDDTARAVAAAVELSTPPAEFDFIRDLRIGISRGLMYVGTNGGKTRRTYAGLGPEVNLAARLMNQARPGQVLVTRRIAKTAAGFAFHELDALPLKGIARPVVLYSVDKEVRRTIERGHHRNLSRAVVGRTRERRVISQQLDELLGGTSGCLIFEGIAGIGKSHLISALQKRARAADIPTLVGVADAAEHATAYYAWRPVFGALLGAEEKEGIDRRELSQRIAARVAGDDHLTDRLPLLSVVLPVEIPDTALTAQMTGEVRAANTRETLARLLEQMCEERGALLIIFEDLQWMDSASWGLMKVVHHQLHPLLLVLETRPLETDVPKEFDQLCAHEQTQRLRIEQLGRDDILAVVRDRLGARELADDVAELLWEKAEGNPFFSEELTYTLRDTGLLEIDSSGVCQFTAFARNQQEFLFPDTIQGVVTSRIDNLPPELQTTLRVASVLGRVFAFRTLKDIYPIEADRELLADNLSTLETKEITRRHRPPPDLKYVFQHNILHEVTYNLMLYAQRRGFHRRIAEWYEKHQAENLAPYFPLLAHHWTSAEDPDHAIGYLEKSGEQALQNFANEEAIEFFAKAIELAEKHKMEIGRTRRSRWRLKMAEAHVHQSKYTEARQLFVDGLIGMGYPVPQGKFHLVRRIIGQALRQLRNRFLPGRRKPLDSESQQVLRDISLAYEKLSEIAIYRNEIGLVVYAMLATLNVAEKAGPCPELARGFGVMGVAMGMTPLRKRADRYFERAMAVADEVQNLGAQSYVHLYAGMYKAQIGEWAACEQHWDTAEQLLLRLGDRRLSEGVTHNRAQICIFRGQFNEGLRLMQELDGIVGERTDLFFVAVSPATKATHLNYIGQPDQAVELVQRVFQLYRENADMPTSAPLLMALGEQIRMALNRGGIDEAVEVADRLAEAVRKNFNVVIENGRIFYNLADAYLTAWEEGGESSSLRKMAANACRYIDKFAQAIPIGRPQLLLARGRYLYLLGKWKKAHQLWRKNLELCEKLAMPYEEALTRLEIGRRLEAGDPARVEQLNRSIEIFSALSAAPDLERARRASQAIKT